MFLDLYSDWSMLFGVLAAVGLVMVCGGFVCEQVISGSVGSVCFCPALVC